METALVLVLIAAAIAFLIWWLSQRSPQPGGGGIRHSSTGFILQGIRGPLLGQSFPVGRSGVRFGRQQDNNVILDGPLVSRRHAELMLTDVGFVLRDLDSTNGTWVGGNRIVEHTLQVGDSFQIGPYVFVLARQSEQGVTNAQGSQSSMPLPIPEPAAQPQQYIPSSYLSMEAARRLRIEDYDLEDTIGAGAAAVVFLGRHRSTGETAAIKILRNSAEDYFRQKFAHEASLALHLKHTNIVRAFAAAEEPDSSYIIMEYLKDGSLRTLLTLDGGKLPLSKAIDITCQLCAALDFAHDLGVYHRDLKPENVLMDGNVAKLGDFGIARLTGVKTVTRDGMIVGTPAYMSYEQARGIEVNRRSDQYSLGIVLFEMLTGQLPFMHDNPLEIVTMHLSKQPPRPRSINSDIPAAVEDVVLRALNKDSKKRYATMADMARALGGQTSARPMTMSPQAQYKPTADSPRLVNPSTGVDIALRPGETVIGRHSVGGHNAVSKEHACFRRNGNVVTVQDLNSLNGTWVDNRRINSIVVLSPGATVRFGPVAFRFMTG